MDKRNREVITQTRSQALERMQRNQMLAQTYQLEKQRIEQIIDLALMVEHPANHWQEYTLLKAMASHIVGFQARHDELATPEHYMVVLDFIDWLLPNPDEQEEDVPELVWSDLGTE